MAQGGGGRGWLHLEPHVAFALPRSLDAHDCTDGDPDDLDVFGPGVDLDRAVLRVAALWPQLGHAGAQSAKPPDGDVPSGSCDDEVAVARVRLAPHRDEVA